jgi:GNAT superfamily N-acetyltransferase
MSSTIHAVIAPMTRQHARAAAAMQAVIYPTLTPEELFTAEKYDRHLELFPEGQFVALVTDSSGKTRVAGSTSTFRTRFDFHHYQHTYLEAIAHGWLTSHNPHGEWLYGADMAVHPDFRGMGLARRMYDMRRELVRQLNLRGEIAGAMLPGYERCRSHLPIEEYVRQVEAGKVFDPTLSVQVRNGFRVHGVLYDHITDPRSDNCAALIVRKNPAHRAK